MTMEPGMTPIRLLVVDDHNLFRRGLIALLAQDSRFAAMFRHEFPAEEPAA